MTATTTATAIRTAVPRNSGRNPYNQPNRSTVLFGDPW